MSIIINPGSGPVEGTAHWAYANMRVLAADLHDCGFIAAVLDGPGEDQGDGRWTFTLLTADRTVEVEMPGLPIERVRYMQHPGQDIWDFPRLYVDGSSWVWCFALDAIRHDP